MQGGAADVWKENMMEELETGKIEYEIAEEFLMSLKKEFGGGEEESVKAAELRKLEQGGKTMTFSVAEEASAFSAGNNRACSNERGRENEHSGGKGIRIEDGGFSKKGPLCYGSGS